jgi:outer membrane protein TolC
MRILKVFIATLILLFGCSVAFTQTLREAVQQAISSHPEIMLNRAQALAAKSGIKVAKGATIPL